MPRAVNQSMAWVIATVLSILLFTGGLALFGTIKPKDKGFAKQPIGAHDHGEASEGSHGEPAADRHQHDSKEEPTGHDGAADADVPAAHGHEETTIKNAHAQAGEEEISAEQFKKNGIDAEKEAHGGHGEH